MEMLTIETVAVNLGNATSKNNKLLTKIANSRSHCTQKVITLKMRIIL